jgi:hypothetical protein
MCVEDNVCSIDEKLKGDCNDCKPDFSVIEIATPESYYAPTIFYNSIDKTVTAQFCVENKGGPYVGQVKTSWLLSANGQNTGAEVNDYAYFNSNDIQFDGSVQLINGSV